MFDRLLISPPSTHGIIHDFEWHVDKLLNYYAIPKISDRVNEFLYHGVLLLKCG